eukprot:scaffold84885_cov30-Tisochrysis_lutea.AAC.7
MSWMSGAARSTASSKPSFVGGGGGGKMRGGGGGGGDGGDVTGGTAGGGGATTEEWSTVSTDTVLDEDGVAEAAVGPAPCLADPRLLAGAEPPVEELKDGKGDRDKSGNRVRVAEVDAVLLGGQEAEDAANNGEEAREQLCAQVETEPELRRALFEDLEPVLEHRREDANWGKEEPRQKHEADVDDVRPVEFLLDEDALGGRLVVLASVHGRGHRRRTERVVIAMDAKGVAPTVRENEDGLAATRLEDVWRLGRRRARVRDVEVQPQGRLPVLALEVSRVLGLVYDVGPRIGQ